MQCNSRGWNYIAGVTQTYRKIPPTISGSILRPLTANMSSQDGSDTAVKCHDGIKIGSDICATKAEVAPWLALDFGYPVEVTRVVVHTGPDDSQMKNLVVRLTDTLPSTSDNPYTGGTLLGGLPGPFKNSLTLVVTHGLGVKSVRGKYVLIQLTHEDGKIGSLKFIEVTATGLGKLITLYGKHLIVH
jgi:hypothetical protein